LLVLASCAPAARGPSVSLPPIGAKPEVLPSGLTLMLAPSPGSGLVRFTTVIDTGSSRDPEGMEGLAHMVEHLSYRATLGSNGERVIDVIKDLGGDMNAWTRRDDTEYTAVAPKEALPRLLEIERHRLSDTVQGVTPDALAVEREVVKNELHSRSLDAASLEVLQQMLFPPGHPYRRPLTQGAAVGLDDAAAFARRWYRPERATISVSGDFDPPAVTAFFRESLPGESAPVRDPAVHAQPPKRYEAGPRALQAPVGEATVILGWSLPGGYRSDQPLVEVSVAALQGAVATLVQDQVDDLHCATSIGEQASLALCSMQVIEGGSSAEQIGQKAVDGIYALYDDRQGEWQARTFAAARARFVTSLLQAWSGPSRDEVAARFLLYTGRADPFAEWLSAEAHVDDDAIRRFAYHWLTRDRVSMLILSPAPPDAAPATIAFDSRYSWPGATFDAPANDALAKLSPDAIAALGAAPDLAGLRDLTLPNGLRAILLPHGAGDRVRISLRTEGGYATAVPWGFPDFAFYRFPAGDPVDFGGTWSATREPDGEVISLDVPRNKIGRALALLQDRLDGTRSLWDRGRFHEALENARRRSRAAGRRPETIAYHALWEHLLPGHPLASKGYDVPRLEEVDRDRHDAWWKSTHAPKNATLVIAGPIDPGVEETVLKTLGSWRRNDPGETMPPLPAPPAAPARTVLLVDRRAGSQTDVETGCLVGAAPGGSSEDDDVLAALLREDLWISIRDRAGASYGSEVSLKRFRGGTGILLIRAEVDSAKAVPALDVLFDRLHEIARGREPEGRLTRIKAILARRTHIENVSVEDLSRSVLELARLGRPLDDLRFRPRRLADVQREDLGDLLSRCEGHEIVTLTGPADALEPLLAARKLPVERVAKPD
jgi:zinc protease